MVQNSHHHHKKSLEESRETCEIRDDDDGKDGDDDWDAVVDQSTMQPLADSCFVESQGGSQSVQAVRNFRQNN